MKNFFDVNRVFGVEIEFLSTIDRYALQNKCRELGVNCYVEGYNHLDNDNYWKIVTDSSCGLEIVSPRLKGIDGVEQIKKVCEALNSLGAKVDKSCGLHIHHDARDFRVSNFKNILINYIKFEKVFDSMMPNSRRSNTNNFCKSLFINSTPQMVIDRIKEAKTVRDLESIYYYNRYYKVNLESFVRHGSIEFRQHSGTTDAEKIINWLMITQALVNTSFGRVKAQYNEKYENIQVMAIALKLQPYQEPDEMMANAFNFAKSRIKHFAKEAA